MLPTEKALVCCALVVLYVDAVAQKAGASSYVNGSKFVPLPITAHDATSDRIQRAFAQWG